MQKLKVGDCVYVYENDVLYIKRIISFVSGLTKNNIIFAVLEDCMYGTLMTLYIPDNDTDGMIYGNCVVSANVEFIKKYLK